MIKKIVKSLLPNSSLNYIRTRKLHAKLKKNYKYDMTRFLTYSSSINGNKSFDNLIADIVFNYHAIEKGLTLRETRLGFGKERILQLLDLLDQYISLSFDKNNSHFLTAISVLDEYVKFHKNKSYNVKYLEERLEKFLKTKCLNSGGVISFSKEDILSSTKADFKTFCNNRYSVRDFDTNRSVDMNLIEESIVIAQKSPSVCNRQSSRVYVVDSNKGKELIQKIQNGNRGFGHLADKYIIITSNLSYFKTIGERNQAYIDGGLFGMSLIYAFHYNELAACSLNWCVEEEKDILLRKELDIPENEVVLFIIALGHYADTFKIAKSHRPNVKEIYKIR